MKICETCWFASVHDDGQTYCACYGGPKWSLRDHPLPSIPVYPFDTCEKWKSRSMTVLEIVKKYLQDNGYDGLYGDECACCVDDLIPCDADFSDCKPGYKNICVKCAKYINGDCESFTEFDGSDDSWIIGAERCFVAKKEEEVE